MCPIVDPVITPQGNIFERESIERWVRERSECPLTKQPLRLEHIKPAKFSSNIANFRQLADELKALTEEYKQLQEEMQDE